MNTPSEQTFDINAAFEALLAPPTSRFDPPNETTQAAMTEARSMSSARFDTPGPLFDALETATRATLTERDKRNHIAFAGLMLQEACHGAAKEAGWWVAKDGSRVQDNPYAFSNKLALIHSEISEAMEGDRKSLQDDHLPHRSMREVELADAVIRIMDLAGAYGMDIGGAITEKMAYNAQRADHKPEARAAAGGKAY